MNLYSKILATEPGKHAEAIGKVLYELTSKLSERDAHLLTGARTYLESLAIAEITKAEPWAAELADRARKETP
jgi:hypothetical protein